MRLKVSTSVGQPEIGQWYARGEKGQEFRVVGRDTESRTIEIQTFDGELDEIDAETWGTLSLERVEAQRQELFSTQRCGGAAQPDVPDAGHDGTEQGEEEEEQSEPAHGYVVSRRQDSARLRGGPGRTGLPCRRCARALPVAARRLHQEHRDEQALAEELRRQALVVEQRLLIGVGEGATFPVATRAMQAWTSPGRRGFAQGITHAFARLGNAVTPPIVAWLIVMVTWRGAFVALGCASLLWVFTWVWYFRDVPA